MFTKLKKVYSNFHCKQYAIEKFKKLMMSLGFFNTFYLEFIKLATRLKITKKILLQKFMHKLSPYLQEQINFELEYPDNIKNLAVRC